MPPTTRKQAVYLPDEMMLEIFSFLPTPHLCRIGQTCTRFYELSSKPMLWQSHLSGDFIHSALHQEETEENVYKQEDDAESTLSVDAKTLYAQRMQKIGKWQAQWQTSQWHFLVAGLLIIVRLLLSIEPNMYLIPNYLNKTSMTKHFLLLKNGYLGARIWLMLVSLTLFLLFMASAVDIGGGSKWILAGVLFACSLASISQSFVPKSQFPIRVFANGLSILIIYLCISVLKPNYDFFTIKATIMMIMTFIHAVDECIPRMLFELFPLKSELVGSTWQQSTHTVLSSMYNNSLNQVIPFHISVPLIICIGIVLGTGGLRLIGELILLAILILLSSFTGIKFDSADTNMFNSIFVVAFFAIISAVLYGISLFIFETKSRRSWLQRYHRNRGAQTDRDWVLHAFQLASWLLTILFLERCLFVLLELQDLWNKVAPFRVLK